MLFFRKHHGLFGVLTAMALLILKVAVAVIKDVIHPLRPNRREAEWSELRRVLRILLNTKLGTEPTR
jgi:hypothetical protein